MVTNNRSNPVSFPTICSPLSRLSYSFFPPVFVLVFILLVLPAIFVGLGGQGVRGILNGLILGIQTWKVLQDPKDFGSPTSFLNPLSLSGSVVSMAQLAPKLADSALSVSADSSCI